MGTRGAYGFVRGDNVKVTYKHFDSYPEGLGEKIVAYCRERTDEQLSADFDAIRLVSEEEAPTEEDARRCEAAGTVDTGVGTPGQIDWYKLLRKAQGDLAAHAKVGLMTDSRDFLKDSLFCEWAYLINLDDGTLDVYRGFQHSPPTDGMFAGSAECDEEVMRVTGSSYYPVNRIARFPLTDLPGVLVDALPRDDEEDAAQ